MKQPPNARDDDEPAKVRSELSSMPPPMWRRPAGVAPGTWQYFHQRSIADHYDAFVEGTLLCKIDLYVLSQVLAGPVDGRSQTVLDLGCGTGRAALPLARRGYDVIAIDLSRPMLRILTQKANAEATVGRVHPLRANLADLNCIADGSADHAICMFATLGMIQGRKHRREMIRHVARIVRPGGTFIIHVHNRWAALREPAGLRNLARSWLRSTLTRNEEFGDATYAYRGLEDMFMHRFSQRELVSDMQLGGWQLDQLIRLSIDGGSILKGRAIAGGFIAVATNRS